MESKKIQQIVFDTILNYCRSNEIEIDINTHTPLIGSNAALDSIGLVNVIVDIETAFLDEDVEISLTSEAAMSSRISPFRSVSSLCEFIAKQLNVSTDE